MGNLLTCTHVLNVSKEGNFSKSRIPAQMFDGTMERNLRDSLWSGWAGTCASVQLVCPIYPGSSLHTQREKTFHRNRRALQRSFDSNVYLDSTGVPKGVPNEFKAQNQIAAGFESALFRWSTTNKNVDWINYIYYNQGFINYTRDACQGEASQLDATSRTAWKNRTALGMMSAEKGGVCVMLGGKYIFIPYNTAPDGTITKALQGLTTLANELPENPGISDPFTDWLGWCGKWKGGKVWPPLF